VSVGSGESDPVRVAIVRSVPVWFLLENRRLARPKTLDR